MANVAKISVELNLDDGSFTANMAKAAGAIEGFKRQADGTAQTLDRMERALGSFDGAMRGGLSRLAPMLGGWAVQTVRANVEMERMTAILKRFSTASTAAAREQEVATSQSWLSRMAKSAPYDITTLTAAFAALRAGGIDPTDGSLQALADSMAATGSGSQGLQRVSVAIQQMAADGKVSMDELRQLTGTVPDAMSLMARSMGLSVSELASRVSSGTVEAGSALGAMFAEMERTFGGSAQQLMSTFGGQLALLQTNIQGLQTGAGSKAFFDALTAGLTDLNTLLAGPIAQQWADDFGYAMAGVIGYGGVLMQAAVEWRHEILALGKVLAIVFAARTVASGVSGMTAAFSGAVAQIRQMGSVSSTYYTWANRTANVVGLKTMAQYRLAASVGVTAAAMRGLRMVMSTMLGPVGIAIGLLLELAHAAGFLTDQSARAVEDIGNGLISERAVEIVKKRRGELENEIEELKSKIQSDSEKLGKIGPDNVDGTSAI
ncbi:MAG TPA: tape measure protein, partial [Kaistia sp.]|nr:tape measure protein [Kaistia sp.]